MGPFTSVAIFLTIWWTVLFAVLPWGVVTHAEAGLDKGDGGDPAAPVNPRLKQKFLITTGISVVIYGVIWLVLLTGVIKLPALPSGY